MAPRTPFTSLGRLAGRPGPTGLAVGLTLVFGFLLVSGSVDAAVASAVPLVVLGLVCAYAVDTALRWGRWLGDVTRDRPDTPMERLRAGRGRTRPLGSPDADAGAGAEAEVDPVVRARERYVAGELDELGLERELEAALGGRGRRTNDGASAAVRDGAARPAEPTPEPDARS